MSECGRLLYHVSVQWSNDQFGYVTRSALLTIYLMTFFVARHIPSHYLDIRVLPIARYVYSLVILLYSTYCIGVGRGLDVSVSIWFRDISSIRYWESSLVLSGSLSVLIVRGMFN
jgi:hypothetical protein